MKPHIPDGAFLKQRSTKISNIVAHVSRSAGVKPKDIMGRSHQRHIVRARFAAMAICRDYLDMSYPAIGRVFGRDHTSVMNAMRRVDELCDDTDLNDFEEIARRAGLVEGE